LRDEGFVGFLGPLQAVHYGAYKQAKRQQRTRVLGQSYGVDRLNFQEAKNLQYERNDDGKNEGEYRYRDGVGDYKALPRTVGI
jgi:hypothetical protein